jgi:ATP-binding cassette subfamily B protein
MLFDEDTPGRWPPSEGDLKETQEICTELGISRLTRPHARRADADGGRNRVAAVDGERSRLYLARALLQKARMVILDESFAALDPETLNRALQCVLKRASTLRSLPTLSWCV